MGKTWHIPADAEKPRRSNGKPSRPLLEVLRAERASDIHGGIYHRLQVDMAYNSNHIEGSTLTHEQTRHIFETATVGLVANQAVRVDDIVKASNHFRAFDQVLDRTIIDERLKLFYYRGIARWDHERGWLRDTCLAAQDAMREVLASFRIDVCDGA